MAAITASISPPLSPFGGPSFFSAAKYQASCFPPLYPFEGGIGGGLPSFYSPLQEEGKGPLPLCRSPSYGSRPMSRMGKCASPDTWPILFFFKGLSPPSFFVRGKRDMGSNSSVVGFKFQNREGGAQAFPSFPLPSPFRKSRLIGRDPSPFSFFFP